MRHRTLKGASAVVQERPQVSLRASSCPHQLFDLDRSCTGVVLRVLRESLCAVLDLQYSGPGHGNLQSGKHTDNVTPVAGGVCVSGGAGESCRSYWTVRRYVMSLQKQELNSVIADLRDLPLERLAELGDSVLAHSIELYLRRLKETGVPLNNFNSRI